MTSVRNSKLISILLVLLILVVGFYFADTYNIADTLFSVLSSLFPFFIAFFISWLMRPIGSMIHKYLKIKERTANVLAVLLNFILIFSFFFVIIPIFIFQFISLIEISDSLWYSLQQNLEVVNEWYIKNQSMLYEMLIDIRHFIENNSSIDISEIVKNVSSGLTDFSISFFKGFFNSIISIISFFIQIIVAYIIAFYFVSDLNSFTDKTLHFVLRDGYPKFRPTLVAVSETLFSYLRGLLIDCSIVAIAIGLGCYFMGLPSALFLGLLAGVFNIIPYLGPILGGFPIFIIALSQSWVLAIISLVLIFGVQFIEANFLQPRIMANATNLHPASVIVGLLIFSTLFGFVGMVISTPSLAVINVILKHSKYDIHI